MKGDKEPPKNAFYELHGDDPFYKHVKGFFKRQLRKWNKKRLEKMAKEQLNEQNRST